MSQMSTVEMISKVGSLVPKLASDRSSSVLRSYLHVVLLLLA